MVATGKVLLEVGFIAALLWVIYKRSGATAMLKIDGSISDKTEILKDKRWQPFQQVFTVFAKKIDEDFEVDTPHGTVSGEKGDYLVMGPQGNKWIMKAALFEKTYQKL